MDKREFSKVVGAILMGLTSSASNAAVDQGGMLLRKKKSIVIGAGLAGLAAAHRLQKNGHEVVVLEARGRIGGRVFTSTQWPGIPLDLGATWIHGVRGNPLTVLADEMKAKRLATSYERAATYNTAGRLLAEGETQRLDKLRKHVFSALKAAQQRDADVSIRQVVEPLVRQSEGSSEAYRFLNFVLNAEIEQEYSGGIESLSAQWFDSAKEFPGGDALFEQGFGIVTAYLSRNLKLELEQVVTEIQWQSPTVRVVTTQGEFVGDNVIVTLPLGVLQAGRVRFSPALPDLKQEAIAGLGMGVLNKCYLRFKEAFWPADADWLEYISAKPGEWTEWVSFKRTANLPVLLGFNAATRGREIEAWTDEQIVVSAMQTLRAIYGRGVPDPIDHQITRWAADPFSLGSYSYTPVGASPTTRKVLAASLKQRLYFAGEATSHDYFGTAHGAYLSGLRAADEVLEG
jgi:monoamine oxidase